MNMVDPKIRQEELLDSVRRGYTLRLIYDLKINDILNRREDFMSAKEICDEISGRIINPVILERILRYLVCFKVLEERCIDEQVFFKTTEFLKLPDIKILAELYQCGPKYIDYVEGKTNGKSLFESTHGMTLWEFLDTDRTQTSNFMAYMDRLSSLITPLIPKIVMEIQDIYKSDAFTIMDVGGATGFMLKHIKEYMPNIKCINFDLPQIIKNVSKIKGVELISGDMFDVATLPSCDIIFTKNILHDWPDKKCLEFLQNFHHVLNDDGILLSVNNHMPENDEKTYPNWLSRSRDIRMMEYFGENAKERTLQQYTVLHKKADFCVMKYVVLGPVEQPVALLICKKTNLKL